METQHQTFHHLVGYQNDLQSNIPLQVLGDTVGMQLHIDSLYIVHWNLIHLISV